MPDDALFPVDDRTPRRLSDELRRGTGGHLADRRRIIASALVAAGAMGVVTLYQTGILRRLPDLPGRWFDAEQVDASDEAYQWFSMPDAPLGLASYAGTVVLAALGGEGRARRIPWVPLVLAAKTGLDAAQAALLTRDQWTRHKTFCSWCLGAAGASFYAFARSLPEARTAWMTLSSRTH